VSGSSQLVGECEESLRLALCVMEQKNLGHDALPTKPGNAAAALTLRRHEQATEDRHLSPGPAPVFRKFLPASNL
jgi:hypothetical protein